MPLRTRPDSVLTPDSLALGRAGAGTVMLVRPRLLPEVLGVDSATAARTAWAVQMLGARELALGLGTLAARRSGDARGGRLWAAAGVLADGIDALAMAGALARGRVRRTTGLGVLAVAATAVVVGVRDLQEEQVPPL